MTEGQPTEHVDTEVRDDIAAVEALYNAAAATPGLELVLNPVVKVEGDEASVANVRVVLGGDLRAPRIVVCERVTASLHRSGTGRWQVVSRA